MPGTPKPGDRIGRYVLESLLGEGGMGHVFRAYDDVLRRRVAVKVLRAAAVEAGSGEGSAPTVGRILREARMAAALDHPNVVSIFDFGEDEGVPYIVMELVAGRSLRAFVGQADVPVEERVRWLVDVARALAAAHKAGMVHRDVKPENVLLRDDGVVKVLDFGIARRSAAAAAVAGPTSAADPHRGPSTLTIDEGLVVGTPGYMAPEQLVGGPVDARVDQFAWGVLAYELLTGRLPWKPGAVVLDVLSPDTVRVPADEARAPAAVTRAIERALRKKADDRFASTKELLEALGASPHASTAPPRPASREELGVAETVAATPGPGAPTSATVGGRDDTTLRKPRGGAWTRAGALGIVALLGVAFLLRARAKPPAPPPSPPSAPPPAGATFDPHDVKRITFGYGCEEYPSITADGRTVVFDAANGADYHVYALDLASGAQREVTRGAGWQYAPSVSPDGRWVAFLRKEGKELTARIVPLATSEDGGDGERVLTTGRIRPRWSPDGRAVWVGQETARRLDVATGEVTRTIEPPQGYLPILVDELADGRAVVMFVERETHRMRGLGVYAPASAEPRWLTHDRLDEVLTTLPDGEHLFVAHVSENTEAELWRLPLDGGAPEAFKTPGEPPQKGLAITPSGDRAIWSNCGIHASLSRLAREGDGGVGTTPVFPSAEWTDDAPSTVPGTSRVVVLSDRSNTYQLWVLDTSGAEGARQIATPGLVPGPPSVSADGQWIVFSAVAGGIYVVPTDGTQLPRKLTSGDADTSACFARSGEDVFFQTTGADGATHVASVPFAGGEPVALLGPGTSSPSADPARDVLAYVAAADADAGAVGHAMLLDLHTHRSSPLAPKVGAHPKSTLRLSPDGKRAVIWTGTEIVEIDRSTGKVVLRFDSGADQLGGVAYVGGELLTSRHVWSGDLWVGSEPFR